IAGPIEQLVIQRDGVGLAPLRERDSAEPPDTTIISSCPSLRAHKETFVTKVPIHQLSRHDGFTVGDIYSCADKSHRQHLRWLNRGASDPSRSWEAAARLQNSAVAELRRTMQKSSVSLAGNRGKADGPCPQVARTTSFDRGSTVATTHCRQQSRVAMAGNTRCPLILDDAALDDAD